MKAVLWSISGVCMVLAIGLFGGVENGEPFSNVLWCIPLMAVSLITGFFARG